MGDFGDTVKDVFERLEAMLASEGVQRRDPLIVDSRNEIFIYDKETIIRVPHSEVPALLEQTGPYSECYGQLALEWFPTSHYRRIQMGAFFDAFANPATEDTRLQPIAQRLRIEWGEEYLNKDSIIDRQKEELTYTYGVTGGKLERLHTLLNGDSVDTQFGLIKGWTNMLDHAAIGYKESKGFFEDVVQAVQWLAQFQYVETENLYGPYAHAHGTTVLPIGEKTVTLHARCSMEPKRSMSHFRVETQNLDVSLDEALRRINIYANDWAADIDAEESNQVLQADAADGNITAHYFATDKCYFYADDPQLFEKHIPSFLEAILKE